MRVAIAYNFHDRDWFGGRNYFASLLHALRVADAPAIEPILVLGHRTETTLPAEVPWVATVRTALMDRMHPGWIARQCGLRLLDRDPLLASFLRRHRVDILSHSGYLGPRPGLRVLPWLYDFQFLHLPQFWHPKHIRWATRRYRASLEQADGVIVSSRDALADLRRFAPDHASRVHVLPFVSNPVDFDRMPSAGDLRDRWKLPERYFYLPNQFWENKNHGLMVRALAILQARGVDATVVCTGQTHDGRQPGYFDTFVRTLRDSGIGQRLRILGVVPRADTQGLMRHALAVVNPSRFEGWSTTVEEAKTLGVPLLLADIPVHREQADGIGRFFGVDDPVALADAMQAVTGAPQQAVVREDVEERHRARLVAFGRTYAGILSSTMAASPRGDAG